ncbi:MAG: hypothetical protein J6L58_00005 [Clostridia bacterium]|nr:hypothetical protein [Clostridia bacterium]
MSMLEEIYYGNIVPSEKFVKNGSEHHMLTLKLLELEDKLYRTLNGEEKTFYEQIIEIRCKQEDIVGMELFIDGFEMGSKIMLEILTKRDSQFE